MTHPDLDRLAAGKYISLTTFRTDGTPVPTPVWVTTDGVRLYVITDAGSGKVRRLRADPHVTVASCDARGTVSGSAVPGQVRLLDDDGTAAVVSRVTRRYGVLGRVLMMRDRLRRSGPGRIGLEITLT